MPVWFVSSCVSRTKALYCYDTVTALSHNILQVVVMQIQTLVNITHNFMEGFMLSNIDFVLVFIAGLTYLYNKSTYKLKTSVNLLSSLTDY